MRTFRRLRDICLLLTVIVYSGAHMPSGASLGRIAQSFADGYHRGASQQK